MLSATPYIYGKRIAVLTPQVEGIAEPDVVPRFVAGLEETGMTVERISAYVTRATPSEWQEEACRLIHRKEVECVVFTSGTEISVLLHALSLYTPDIHAFLADIRIVCYGPYTASHARKLGLPVDFVSAHFGSFGEFTRSLTEFYS
jgi:uroporphyrinogen-III synthase